MTGPGGSRDGTVGGTGRTVPPEALREAEAAVLAAEEALRQAQDRLRALREGAGEDDDDLWEDVPV